MMHIPTQHKVAAYVTTVALISASSDVSWAATLSSVSDNLKNSVSDTPKFMTAFCYLAGSLATVAGILKTRDHINSPSNVPLKDGVARLSLAGFLFASPYAASVIQTTIGDPSTTGTVTQSNIISGTPSY